MLAFQPENQQRIRATGSHQTFQTNHSVLMKLIVTINFRAKMVVNKAHIRTTLRFTNKSSEHLSCNHRLNWWIFDRCSVK